MYLTKAMEDYLRRSQDELKALIRDLCAIPAPSHQEDARAAYVRDWLKQAGGCPEIDEAKNVICPLGDDKEGDVVVFMAHTDTVFPDLAPMPFREEGGKYFCPGVCDDTANLAALLLCARYFLQNHLQTQPNLIFVANSCEEGLGNLKGCRAVAARYGDRLRALITLDGVQLNAVVSRAVGSHRYRVVVKTEGGHSFNAFGNRNAIRYLASMIDTLYAVKPPQDGDSKTTYNVGLISGGTSVNTIAQEAEMLYEYRSDSKACLAEMEGLFFKVVETYRAMGVTVEVERIGERPCAGDVDPTAYQALMERVTSAIQAVLGQAPVFRAGSTDCNIPLSLGIPAVCVSACAGAKCHTREEELELDSLLPGSRLVMELLAGYLA